MPDSKGISSADRTAAWEAYLAARLTPGQRRLRERKAWFVAAVWWKPGDCTLDLLRRELGRMREVGFTAVRYHTHHPTEVGPGQFDFSRTDAWMDAAAEAGLGVIYHLNTKVPDAVLARHGIGRAEFDGHHLDEPRFRQAIADWIGPVVRRYAAHPALLLWHGFGEPHGGAVGLEGDHDRRRFADWLRGRYGTVEALDRAWNIYPEAGRPTPAAFEEAAGLADGAERGAGQTAQLVQAGPFGKRLYGANRDLIRYLTEKGLARVRAWLEAVRQFDPDHPVMVGAHQLFACEPYFRWDIGAWARQGDCFGTSIHLSWHFDAVRGEVDRPVYMQARLTRDALPGGLASAFETTGGAVQYSGGYGNAMTPGLMRRLAASYLAAGNLALAFWTWNHRPGCWEAGEYGLTTLSGRVAAWTAEIGKAARGLQKHHAELWDADPEARVAVLRSWDTDAVLLQEPERHDLRDGPSPAFRGTKMQAVRARIGLSRALINTKTPFAYLSEEDLAAGLGPRYPALYVPHARALGAETVEALGRYAEAGGRLVADVQFAFLDPWGKLHPAGEGGPVERVFGAWMDTHHDARTAGMTLGTIPIRGFWGDLVPTSARVLARFADGRPAIAERQVGRGTAVLVAFDAARMCFEPGQEAVERLIASLVWGGARPAWESDAPMAFRLAAPRADHYFLLNDGPARPAFIKAYDRAYARGEDVFDGRAVEVRGTIAVALPAESALWLRFERA